MQNSSDKELEQQESIKPSEAHTNLDLIYEYTENVLNSTSRSIDDLNGRLTTVIGFSGALLVFTVNLPGKSLDKNLECYPCLTLKILVCLALAASIILSAWGLKPSKTGYIVRPGELLDRWYYEPNEKCKLYIAKSWRKAVEDLDESRGKKIKLLVYATYSIIAASLLVATDVIWASLLK